MRKLMCFLFGYKYADVYRVSAVHKIIYVRCPRCGKEEEKDFV